MREIGVERALFYWDSLVSYFSFFCTISLELAVLGNIHNVDLRAEINDKIHQKRTLAAKRGTIYDASGSPIAVLDATNYSIYAVLTDQWSKNAETPDYVTDINKTAEALSKHISLSKEEIVKDFKSEGCFSSRIWKCWKKSFGSSER